MIYIYIIIAYIITAIYNHCVMCMYTVLATIEGEIENVTISRGESAEFTCKFSKGDVDIDINWSVGDIVFDECGSTKKDILSPDSNGCYTTDAKSVLLLQNTSALVFCNVHEYHTCPYPVQCVLQQNIRDDFKKDPTFKNHFNTLASSSYLFIKHKDDSEDHTTTCA